MASLFRVGVEHTSRSTVGRTVRGVTGRVVLLAFVGSAVIVAVALATEVLTALAIGVPVLAIGVVGLVALQTPGAEGVSRDPASVRPAGSAGAPPSPREREHESVGVA